MAKPIKRREVNGEALWRTVEGGGGKIKRGDTGPGNSLTMETRRTRQWKTPKTDRRGDQQGGRGAARHEVEPPGER